MNFGVAVGVKSDWVAIKRKRCFDWGWVTGVVFLLFVYPAALADSSEFLTPPYITKSLSPTTLNRQTEEKEVYVNVRKKKQRKQTKKNTI